MTTTELGILAARDLTVRFPVRSGLFRRISGYVHAVEGVNLTLRAGQTLAIVGESGCGKTTTSRALAGLIVPTAGEVLVDGEPIQAARWRQMARHRRNLQMIFQDPYSSLNPRRTVRQLITEGWEIFPDAVPKKERSERYRELLALVGLSDEHSDRYPHEFSGGQQQRIGIARALALQPRIVICDEPVSALDVTMQDQIMRLLQRLKVDLGLSYVVVSHDLPLMAYYADRVSVMYLGKVVEEGEPAAVLANPTHPYTRALVSAVPAVDGPSPDTTTQLLPHDDVPSPVNPPSGCVFRTRCWKAQAVCSEVTPPLIRRRAGQWSACHFPDNTAGDDAEPSFESGTLPTSSTLPTSRSTNDEKEQQ